MFLKFYKEFLSVGSGLSWSPGVYMLLYFLPLLSENFESFKKLKVLQSCPSSRVEFSFSCSSFSDAFIASFLSFNSSLIFLLSFVVVSQARSRLRRSILRPLCSCNLPRRIIHGLWSLIWRTCWTQFLWGNSCRVWNYISANFMLQPVSHVVLWWIYNYDFLVAGWIGQQRIAPQCSPSFICNFIFCVEFRIV